MLNKASSQFFLQGIYSKYTLEYSEIKRTNTPEQNSDLGPQRKGGSECLSVFVGQGKGV